MMIYTVLDRMIYFTEYALFYVISFIELFLHDNSTELYIMICCIEITYYDNALILMFT